MKEPLPDFPMFFAEIYAKPVWRIYRGRMMRMTERLIIVETELGSAAVQAVARFKGLAVHPGIGADRKKWVVSLAGNGYKFDVGLSSPRLAIARMRKLASMGDWNFSSELSISDALRSRVRRYNRPRRHLELR